MKLKIVIVSLMILTFLLSPTVNAEETGNIGKEYEEMLGSLPNDVAELLPEKLFSQNADEVAEGAKTALSFSYILNVIFRVLGLNIESALKLLAKILGVLVLAAIMNTVKTSFSSPSVSSAFSVCSSCAVFLTAVAAQTEIVKSVSEFFSRLCIFTNTLLPLGGMLYAMGGNVASAVVHHSSLTFFMIIVENLCAKTIMPISGVCMALTAVGAVAPDMNISGIGAFFKRTYTTVLAFLMTIFITVMGGQNLLASKADTLSSKAAKFAMGNLIPMVGSALSNTLGTVSSSVEYIRATVGVVGIIAIVLMVVPTIITLLLTKFVFSLLTGAADVLGCGTEKKIIGELASINGFLLASASICSVCLIFIMTLFAKCSSALGGIYL